MKTADLILWRHADAQDPAEGLPDAERTGACCGPPSHAGLGGGEVIAQTVLGPDRL